MAKLKATVLGAQGFVGQHLSMHLQARGFEVRRVGRGDQSWRGEELGHTFYCVGLTADFRSRPFDTIDAHVSVLADLLRNARFESFVYLSSTRVYARTDTTDEVAPLSVLPHDQSDLYNLSKLMGEATCLGAGVQNARVARLSNVFGDDTTSSNFLTSVMRDAVEKGSVQLATSLASEKDYVWIGDVVAALEALATRGSEKIVNVAGGINTTHRAIMAALSAATGCDVQVVPNAPTLSFPPISTKRLNQLDLGPRVSLTSMLGDLLALFANRSDRSIATENARRANPPRGPD